MIRLRFHGRGGQGAKAASRILGTAAFFEGYYVQDFPLYGAERRGAPIAAFARISREPVLERGVITEPDIVIIMDETILEDPLAHPLKGLRDGGIVFINTIHSPAEARVKYEIAADVITMDITRISLEILGTPVLSALAGGVASRITNIGEGALRKAIEKELSEIISDTVLINKNTEAALRCFHALLPGEIKTVETVHRGSPVMEIPFEPAAVSSPAIRATGNTPLRKTGNWRVFKPIWDYDQCTKCMTCVARCPDGCITVNADGFPCTDYENCKGCMICARECPAGAIKRNREVHAW